MTANGVLPLICLVSLLPSSAQAFTTNRTAYFRGATATDDTTLLEGTPTRHLGDLDVLWSFGLDGSARKSLLRFDLSALAGVKVLSATLRLAHNTEGLGNGYSFSDRKIELFSPAYSRDEWR